MTLGCWQDAAAWKLTVKLRGRPPTPAKRRGRTLSSRARGAKRLTRHGPLQRWLDVAQLKPSKQSPRVGVYEDGNPLLRGVELNKRVWLKCRQSIHELSHRLYVRRRGLRNSILRHTQPKPIHSQVMTRWKVSWGHRRRLTVKLRGRAITPAGRRGRTLSSRARGAKQITPHGPLQRLLDGSCGTDLLRSAFARLETDARPTALPSMRPSREPAERMD